MSAVTATDAVSLIKAMSSDLTKFKLRRRGYVDWKFSELAEYLGYQGAVGYVESVHHWIDFYKYQECLLITTFYAFVEAEKQSTL